MTSTPIVPRPRIVCATCGLHTAPGECEHCGADPSDVSPLPCGECDGQGRVQVLEPFRSHYDQGTVEEACIYCLGSGRIDRPYEDEHHESTWQATAAMPREERLRPTQWERSVESLKEALR